MILQDLEERVHIRVAVGRVLDRLFVELQLRGRDFILALTATEATRGLLNTFLAIEGSGLHHFLARDSRVGCYCRPRFHDALHGYRLRLDPLLLGDGELG